MSNPTVVQGIQAPPYGGGQVPLPSPPGVSTLTTQAGQLMLTPGGSSTPAPVGGGGGGGGGSSSLSTALTRAQLIKASLTVPLYYEDFAYNPGNNQAGGTIAFGPNLAGTGSLTPQTTLASGVILVDTGATANSWSGLIAAGNATSSLVVAPASNPFYAHARVRLQGARDSVSQHCPLFFLVSGFSQNMELQVSGTGVLGLSMSNGTTVALTSAVAGDFSNAHDYAIGFDGTTITAFVDGVAVPGLSTTNISGIPTANVSFGSFVFNGTNLRPSCSKCWSTTWFYHPVAPSGKLVPCGAAMPGSGGRGGLPRARSLRWQHQATTGKRHLVAMVDLSIILGRW